MKLNVKQKVYGPDGEPFAKTQGDSWTLGDILIVVIGNAPVKEKTLLANYERFDLASKIRNAKTVEFTIDEAKTIQDCLVGSGAFGPFVITAAARMLEGSCGLNEGNLKTYKKPKKKK